jgi:ACS family hexuronate transporter-like MFS transporter
MIPAGLKASSEWFPAKERSIAVGYFNVGSSIGAMIAPPLVVWAIVMHSWQMAFIISGVLSFAWAMAWLVFYKHPRDQKNSLKKNATTSLAVRKLSIRPTTAKKCPSGRSWHPSVLGYRPAALPGRAGLGYLQRLDPAVHV